MRIEIPYNVPCYLGVEQEYIRKAVENRHISGNGPYSKLCTDYFEQELGFPKVMLTTSCTAALEMAALLCAFEPGDEVILPTFTHVGTANAFFRAGANLIFADSTPSHPNLDIEQLPRHISPRTKAVVVVHYAGFACDMDALLALQQEHGFLIIEDAAHCIGATWKDRPLGTIGDLGTLSFHETKNITCGHGGLISINNPDFLERAEYIWENGTNRAKFFKGQVDKYSWVDVGSSFPMPDLNAAYLYPQLLHLEEILTHRHLLWETYKKELSHLQEPYTFLTPNTAPDHNAHIFWLNFAEPTGRNLLLEELRKAGILAVFHYIPLHSSPFFRDRYQGPTLPNATRHAQNLLRLPLYHSLTREKVEQVTFEITERIHFVAEAVHKLRG